MEAESCFMKLAQYHAASKLQGIMGKLKSKEKICKLLDTHSRYHCALHFPSSDTNQSSPLFINQAIK